MIILGLGSNLGDRLENLRRTLNLIQKISYLTVKQISPVYISDALLPDNASQTWDIPYLNLALACETQLSPYELLDQIKKIEIAIGRTPEKNWGPRIIDIDILAWDDLVQYDEKLHIPHEHLPERPFALWPLADVVPHWVHPILHKTAAEMVLPWGSRFTGDAPLHTKQIQQRIDTPQLVGILNITPNSFSDDRQSVDPLQTIQQVERMVLAGAEIIDIGAEATNPHSQPITAELEWQRLEPTLHALLPELSNLLIKPKISIDTRHALVAEKCLAMNIDCINDVSGLMDVAMQAIVAQSACDVVVMHHLTIPEDRTISLPPQENVIALVVQWAEKQLSYLEKNGINRKRIIFDIGIGFGKTAEQSLELIKNISVFNRLNTRLLVGHSRKSFLQQFTSHPPAERDLESVVLSLFLAQQKINYLRVHNVEAHSRAFKVGQRLHSDFLTMHLSPQTPSPY